MMEEERMMTEGRKKRLHDTGIAAFFLSGICAISSGVIVSILRDKYGLSFGVTGTLLSCMNIGNMAAAFLAGFLPRKIGTRTTVLTMTAGYAAGYLLMTFFGYVGILVAAFLMVGLAKGCALNHCTVLVGTNTDNRPRSMQLMHSFYALGALLCPFLITGLLRVDDSLPTVGVAAAGLVLWLVFLSAGLPGKPSAAGKNERKGSYAFLRQRRFWILTALIFCQNAAEMSVTGWLVTYYKSQNILSGALSTYTVTVMWGATLTARLLIAFVFPIRNIYKGLSVMGAGCTVLYILLVFLKTPVTAVLVLFCFAFAMAGVNPTATAGIGKEMSTESMGVLLPVGGIGGILFPFLIGFVADRAGLRAGMLCNLLPCVGILALSQVMLHRKAE